MQDLGEQGFEGLEGYVEWGSSEKPESSHKRATPRAQRGGSYGRLQVPGPTADDMEIRVQQLGSATAMVETTPEGKVVVELGGRFVTVQKPIAFRDDISEVELDLGLTYQGMIKELNALESYTVGDLMWTIDQAKDHLDSLGSF